MRYTLHTSGRPVVVDVPDDADARAILAAEVRALAADLLGAGLLTPAEWEALEAERHDERMCVWHDEQEAARAALITDPVF